MNRYADNLKNIDQPPWCDKEMEAVMAATDVEALN
jgi:hypothetical protein